MVADLSRRWRKTGKHDSEGSSLVSSPARVCGRSWAVCVRARRMLAAGCPPWTSSCPWMLQRAGILLAAAAPAANTEEAPSLPPWIRLCGQGVRSPSAMPSRPHLHADVTVRAPIAPSAGTMQMAMEGSTARGCAPVRPRAGPGACEGTQQRGRRPASDLLRGRGPKNQLHQSGLRCPRRRTSGAPRRPRAAAHRLRGRGRGIRGSGS